MKRIALRARDGTVRAYAIVDDDDFEWLSQWRWCLKGPYAARYSKRECHLMHRTILSLTPGDENEGHHGNENKLDNRRANLQVMTKAAHRRLKQGRNIRKVLSGWRAMGWDGERQVSLGVFPVEGDALQAAASYKRTRESVLDGP